MSAPLWLFAAIVAGGIGWVLFTASPAAPKMQGGAVTGKVRYIVDGDTFYLHGHRAAVRIWGIDAPEMAENGGKASRDYLTRLISSKRLTCRYRATDGYNRMVALCVLPDGRDIAAEMIRAGHATEFVRYSKGYYTNIRSR